MELGGQTCYQCDRQAVGWVMEGHGNEETSPICRKHLLDLIREHDPRLAEEMKKVKRDA